MYGRRNVIQIHKCDDCARFTIRNSYYVEKILISLMKMVYNIKVYTKVYHLWPGSGNGIVNTKNC